MAHRYRRAFVFDDGGSRLALVVCDLVFVTHDISSLARRLPGGRRNRGTGLLCLMVTGTHTHSGPAGLTMGMDPVFTETVSRKIAGSVGKRPVANSSLPGSSTPSAHSRRSARTGGTRMVRSRRRPVS